MAGHSCSDSINSESRRKAGKSFAGDIEIQMKLYSPSTIQDIRERYDFKLSKSLGQNFITDRNVIEKIVEGAQIGPADLVIEIGPGIGVLTAAAAEQAARVVAIEIDSKLIPILSETLAGYDNIRIVNQDVLKTRYKRNNR